MSRRRLLAVLVAGALAVPGLAACRDQPTVAAYVEAARLTTDEVEQMVNEFQADVRAKNAGDIRQFVVSAFVAREVAGKLAKQHGLTVTQPAPDQLAGMAQQFGLAPDSAFVKLDAQAEAALAAIQPLGQPQAPTEADKLETFNQLLKENAVRPGSYEAVKSQIDSPQMRAALGLRPVLADAVKRYQVSVNPRYQPVGIPVSFTLAGGQVNASVSVPLAPAGVPAVRDLS
jgi:hypothetical protein